MKTVFNYIRPTIEGNDGKLSMKRITVLLFVILFTIAFFSDLLWDLYVSDEILTLIATMILGGIGLTSGQSLASDYIHKRKPSETSQTSANELGEQPEEGNFKTR